MHIAIFFGGMVVGVIFGLLLAGLIGMAATSERDMERLESTVERQGRLLRDYPLPEKEELP